MDQSDEYQVAVVVLKVAETFKTVTCKVKQDGDDRQTDQDRTARVPRIPTGEKFEYLLYERCMGGIRVEKLPDAERHRYYLNGGGKYRKCYVKDRRLAK